MEIKTIIYKAGLDKEPFTEWRKELELQTQGIIAGRLTRVRSGNLGSCKPIKGYQGLNEIVIDFGPGYRIYYYVESPTTFIILLGGEKKTQKRDIQKAYCYLIDHTGGRP
jgi:putative addiction module killer protein